MYICIVCLHVVVACCLWLICVTFVVLYLYACLSWVGRAPGGVHDSMLGMYARLAETRLARNSLNYLRIA